MKLLFKQRFLSWFDSYNIYRLPEGVDPEAKMSLVGVSVLASAAHNLGQTGAACLVFGSLSPLGMLWWLFLLSAPTGLVTGIPAEIITRRLKPVIRPKGKE